MSDFNALRSILGAFLWGQNMEIVTIKKHTSAEHKHSESKDKIHNYEDDIYGGSPDADYMKHCHEVDINPPETWSKYDMESPAGVRKVIEMEYRELMTATTEADREENIYHLSVALLRMWRLMHDNK